MKAWTPSLGAIAGPAETTFRVWAPKPQRVSLVIDGTELPMDRAASGLWSTRLAGNRAGARYIFRVDGEDTPDPCSRAQPDGVHGASEVVDPRSFEWHDADWRRPPMRDLAIYELHIGTFTDTGDFDSAADELPRIRDLGVTAVEIMPVAAFPGRRNWGYDGVALFAPCNAYGGPEAMRRFVDRAHGLGLAVILDVVYNHFGPDGNYTGRLGPYQTARHTTPWGDAINYDDAGCDGVREFVVENLLHWMHEYHVDGFRFDATHAIHDDGPEHILAEARRRTTQNARNGVPPILIAETDENDHRYLAPLENGGFGFDAVWADDFHGVVRNILHREREGYLRAFDGTAAELARVVKRGWLFDGQFGRSAGKVRGTNAPGPPWSQYVYCIQNHDQVGNRAFGERITATAHRGDVRAATLLLLLLPQTPLLFQGQEFAATTPFLYFTDHSPELGRLVTEGRRAEFAGFAAFADPGLRKGIPDPQAEATFRCSKLRRADMERPEGQEALALHRKLLHLRFDDPVLVQVREASVPLRAVTKDRAILVTIATSVGTRRIAANFGDAPVSFDLPGYSVLIATAEGVHTGASLTVPPHAGAFVKVS